MNSSSAEFVPSTRIGIYEPIHQIGMWGENFKSNSHPTSVSFIVKVDNKIENKFEPASHEMLAPSNKYEQEANKPIDKKQRRLAQNRVAARKSRLRKKAYVQQLEDCRLKLIQMEQALERTRQQGLCIGGGFEGGHLGFSAAAVNSGNAAFEMEYGRWMEEQSRQICNLRAALSGHNISDIELRTLVETGMSHYFQLFRLKSTAAKADVFYVMSGTWKTSAEQFFSWIGGFRPSELLKVLMPQLDSTEKQFLEVCNLKQSCQQAEDALSQGMEKLREIVSETVAAGRLGEGSCSSELATAMEKLEALVSFVNQADHIRQETLQQMSRILTTRQTARGLLALGEYFERLRALSTLSATMSS